MMALSGGATCRAPHSGDVSPHSTALPYTRYWPENCYAPDCRAALHGRAQEGNHRGHRSQLKLFACALSPGFPLPQRAGEGQGEGLVRSCRAPQAALTLALSQRERGKKGWPAHQKV
jgi:hypothetical protein